MDVDLEYFPSNETAKRMLDTVSNGFYDNSYVGKWLFQVMGSELEDARKIVEELPYQAFPETATWGLRYHEQKYNLPIRENRTYEERRNYIFQKRDTRTPMNPFTMERILKSICGCGVSVDDFREVNCFTIYFYHAGVETLSERLSAVKQKVDKMKQSHVAYSIGLKSIENKAIIFSAVSTCAFLRVKFGIELDSHVCITETAKLEIGRVTTEYVYAKFGGGS